MPDLKIEISADLNNTGSSLNQVKEGLKGVKTAATEVENEFTKLGKQLSFVQTNFPKATSRIEELKQKLAALAPAQKALATSLDDSASAANGFSKSIGKAFSGLRTLANIIPGIGIGGLIGLLAGPLVDALAAVFEGFNKTADAARNMKEAFASGKDEFVKATLEVSNLKIAFQQARDGIISKEEALKLYNTTIGKTTGEVKSLDEAEKALSKNAEAYIRFTLLKAAANYSLQKAAEAAFKVEEERNKKAEEFRNSLVDTRIVGPGSTTFNAVEFERDKNRVEKAQEERKQIAIKKAQEATDAQLKIAQKFLDDAEKISKEFKFDFNGIQEPKPAKAKKIKEKIIKALKFKPDDLSKMFFDEATVKLEVPAFVELNFKKSLNAGGNSLDDGLLKGILGPEALTEIQLKANLLGLGISKGIQDGVEVGLDGLRFPELKALEESAQKKAAEFRDFMTGLFSESVVGAFEQLGESIGEALAGATDPIGSFFGGIAELLAKSLKDLGKFIITTSTVIASLKKALNAAFAGNPALGIIAGVALIAIGSALEKAIPKFADGVTNFGGGLALVGERGPELVRLPKGSDVIPNNQLGGISGNTNVFIPDVRIRGNDLVLVFNRASATIGRNG